MQNGDGGRCGLGAAALAVVLVLMLAGCGDRIGGPAPLVDGGGAAGAASPPGQIVVQRGQTLSGIAQTYHVPMQALAEANHLSPPYRIAAGRPLVIPGGGPDGGGPNSAGPGGGGPGSGEPAGPAPPIAVAALPPARLDAPSPPPAPRPVPSPGAAETPPSAPPPAPSRPPPRAPAEAAAPPPALAEAAAPQAAAAPPAAAPPPVASAAPSPPPAAAQPPRGGAAAFLWPVRGRILEGYGSSANGTHNDGINIAAPRGAAVQAADAGVVAYAGNELRGYGNLILVKHPNGWISAYAHCDLILVKKGEKVGRGQVIARVGATGNVSEPQLHFELRRGNKPVDPQEFLAPPPTVATKESRSG